MERLPKLVNPELEVLGVMEKRLAVSLALQEWQTEAWAPVFSAVSGMMVEGKSVREQADAMLAALGEA